MLLPKTHALSAEMLVLLATFILIPLSCQESFAQGIPNGVNREVINVKGQLELIQGFFMRIKSEDGRVFTIKASENQEAIKYTGTGAIAMLQPGLFIRFEAKFDNAGRTVAPLQSLEVFTPYKPKHARPEDLITMMPGVYPGDNAGAGGVGLFEDGAKKPASGPPPMSYKVIGRIAGVSKKGMNINAGRMMVATEVSPTAAISVTAIGWSLAMPGDNVHVSGFMFPPKDTEVLAEQIQITGVKPLGLVEEKPKPIAKTSKRTKPGNDKATDDKLADAKPAEDSADSTEVAPKE